MAEEDPNHHHPTTRRCADSGLFMCYAGTQIPEQVRYLMFSPLNVWGTVASGPPGINNHEANMTTYATVQVNSQFQQKIFIW